MAKATPKPARLTTPAQLILVPPPVKSGGSDGGVVWSTAGPTSVGVVSVSGGSVVVVVVEVTADVEDALLVAGLVVVGARVVVAAVLLVAGATVVVVAAVVVVAGGAVVVVVVVGSAGRIWAPAGRRATPANRAEVTSRPRRTEEDDSIGTVAESSVRGMESTDRSPEHEEPVEGDTSSEPPARPWGPGAPAPGTSVADYDVRRDEAETLRASTASALYDAARFPDLEDVAPAGGKAVGPPRLPGPDGDAGDVDVKGGLRILGVPAPREIAGPVLAALALAGLLYGWRRRRRRRR